MKLELAKFETYPKCPGCGKQDSPKRPLMIQMRTHNRAQMTHWNRLKTWWYKPICRKVDVSHIHHLCGWCGYEWLTELYEDSAKTALRRDVPSSTMPLPPEPEPSLMIVESDESVGRVTVYGWNGSERKEKQPGGGAEWNERLGAWEGARGRELVKHGAKVGGGDRVVDGPDGTVIGYKAGGGDTIYPLPPVGYRLPMPITPEPLTNEKVQKGLRK